MHRICLHKLCPWSSQIPQYRSVYWSGCGTERYCKKELSIEDMIPRPPIGVEAYRNEFLKLEFSAWIILFAIIFILWSYHVVLHVPSQLTSSRYQIQYVRWLYSPWGPLCIHVIFWVRYNFESSIISKCLMDFSRQ